MDLSRHIKPLTGDVDWPMWKRKIRDLLDYHEGAIDVINGNLQKPESLDDNATESEVKRHKELSELFRKANSYAKSMIASTVTDAVYQKIMDKETAYEAWESLKQQFEATSKDQLFKICTEFFAFSWVLGDDVSTHIAKLRNLWNELNNGLEARNETKLPDLMLVCKVLHILPSKFETFQSSWMLLAKDDKKSFEELNTQLCMFERNFAKTADKGKAVQEALVATKPESQKQDSEIFIKDLQAKFKISVGGASCFLGLEIECLSDKSITVSQKGYARKILQRFGFDECKPVATPMLKDLRLQKTEDTRCDFSYRQAVGALMYLMVGTRPDLAYSVGFLSRSLDNPSAEDMVRVKRIFRYIAGTVEHGITYQGTGTKGVLQCYSDSDFGGCAETGRSTSGYVMIYAGGAISWRSQRQAIVTTSTTEAEIVAASEAAKEVIWLSRLLKGMVTLKGVPILQVDNRAAVKLSHNPEYHRRTKHIEIKHFFVREKVLEGKIDVEQVSTEGQVSDIMTKPLMKPRLLTLCKQMGLFKIS